MTYLWGIDDGPSQKSVSDPRKVVHVPLGKGTPIDCARIMNVENATND
jgi:hypothetical protein